MAWLAFSTPSEVRATSCGNSSGPSDASACAAFDKARTRACDDATDCVSSATCAVPLRRLARQTPAAIDKIHSHAPVSSRIGQCTAAQNQIARQGELPVPVHPGAHLAPGCLPRVYTWGSSADCLTKSGFYPTCLWRPGKQRSHPSEGTSRGSEAAGRVLVLSAGVFNIVVLFVLTTMP